MPIVTTKKLLEKAVKGGYAVPHINISNLEHFDTLLKTAENMKSPLIIAFTTGLIKYYGDEILEGLCYAASKKYKFDFAVHLDHHKDPADIFERIKKNKYISSVMIDASLENINKNKELTKKVVAFCKERGISVEAELGAIKGTEDEHESDDAYFTDPDLAVDFIKDTGIDALAISIGTVHGCVSKLAPKLDFDRLEKLKNKTHFPLVLHGSSGLNDSQISEVVKKGIAKINVATEFKVVFHKGLKAYIDANPTENDSRLFFNAANSNVGELLKNKIKIFNSENKN